MDQKTQISEESEGDGFRESALSASILSQRNDDDSIMSAINYTPASDIIRGKDDMENVYWNSFLPIFFDRMTFLMRKAMSDAVEEYGLTSAHSFYLIALNLQDGQTLVEISRFLDMDTANTNRVMKVLKEKGLVRDDRKTPTSKKYSIYLTEKGKEISDRIMDETQSRMNGYFEGISKDEISGMRATLIKILKNVDSNFMKYVDSSYSNPFYTYLSTLPPGENLNIPRTSGNDKKEQ